MNRKRSNHLEMFWNIKFSRKIFQDIEILGKAIDCEHRIFIFTFKVSKTCKPGIHLVSRGHFHSHVDACISIT